MLAHGNTFLFHFMQTFINKILGFNINMFQSEDFPYEIPLCWLNHKFRLKKYVFIVY